ncbi:MAG: sodium:proton exchanger [Rhodobacterales bacterium CG18_big_fil_WC_8_21_14_2_50_71_9]|nr:MAG: sodium:proton exchanger [Rhodobacterales bacterium CG18_big_fil_WC_8_21_14_2_50_71_9]
MDFAMSMIGLALLVGAGDALVRGAVALSLKLGIPILVVSLTVVAFGTSAPELVVGIEAALANADGIAFGNVVGSNIANVLLVLGIPAIINPIDTRDCDGRRSWIGMMLASLLFIALCFMGPLVWWHGAILLAGLTWMLTDAYRHTRAAQAAGRAVELDLEPVDPTMPGWRIAALIAIGCVGLPVGAHLLVEGARGVAMAYGLSEAAIGLTLVAVGTSLPELMTTVMAAIRRHADVAMGNIIGSNLFNLLGIMGAVSFLGPLDVPQEFLTLDLWVMLGCGALLWACLYPRWMVGRGMGVGLVALYVAYGFVVLGPRM